MNSGSDERPSVARANRIDLICDAFEQEWISGNEPDLLRFLDASKESADRNQLFVELLAIEVEYRRHRGESVHAAALVERFPEFATAAMLCGHEPTIDARIDSATRAENSATPSGAGRARIPSPPGDSSAFGDYELLDEIGVGGMGVVYRARQRSANRDVALKVIRPDRLRALPGDSQETAIERFRNEAQAAAQLDHEGIVTVYDVGEVEGQHFFSMRYVDGQSLSDLLRGGPVENRRAARYIEQVAMAVHEAHEQGILHRDLKPQNILIDAKTDRALVADFGLAKLTEGPAELTRFGEVMGTPQYMSPEQASDSASVTAATDVYALGATLYHLLTGRPPFLAATAMDTLKQVINEQPAAPRALNPSIDRDLETICLKCLEKEVGRRYASANELVDELQRYLRDMPIRARPIGPFGSGWRWCRRNPVVATLAVSVAASLLVALVATVVGYIETASAQRASEEGFQDARNALERIVNRVREEGLLNEPELRPLKEDLLREALDYYKSFLAERSSDPAIREEVAATYFRIGLIYEEIVSADEALDAYKRAKEMQAAMVHDEPQSITWLDSLGKTLTALGRVHATGERYAEASRAFDEAVKIRTKLLSAAERAGADTSEYERMLVNSLMNLGILEEGRHRFENAMAHYEKAQQRRRELLSLNAGDLKLRRDYGIGFYNMGHLAIDSGQMEAAETYLADAVEQFAQLHEDAPDDDEATYLLALCRRLLGDLAFSEVAGQGYAEAIATITPLVSDNPDTNLYKGELAQTFMNLGQLRYEEGNLTSSLECLSRAATILQQLRQKDPDLPNYRRNLGIAWLFIGRIELDSGDRSAARQTLQRSEAALKPLVDRYADPEDASTLKETQQLLRQIDNT